MPRYTLSHHSGSPEGDHYDLFLEVGDKLRTWRLRSPDLSKLQSAAPIADHRPIYLDYNGPLSNERGHVRIEVSGTYEATWSERHIELTLDGTRKFSLRLDLNKDEWSLGPR